MASIEIAHCAPVPLPVNEIRGILLVPPGAAYPAPPETMSKSVPETGVAVSYTHLTLPTSG